MLSFYGYKNYAAIVVALLLVFLAGGACVFADSLPDSIVTSSGALSSAQKQQVEKFARPLLKQINSGSDKEVSAARTSLLAPLKSKEVGGGFVEGYSDIVLAPLSQDLSSQKLMVRLNSVIIIGHLGTIKTLDPAAKALEDKSPAVRYWGAKILGDLVASQSSALTQNQKQKINDLLKKQLGKEASGPVLKQVFKSIAASGGPKAVFAALNTRLQYYHAHKNAGFAGVKAVLHRIYVGLVRDTTSGKDISEPLKNLCKATIQYYALAVNQLKEHGKSMPENVKKDRLDMIHDSDSILRYALKRLASDQAPPKSIEGAKIGAIEKALAQWQTILQRSPFKFSKQQVGK